MRSIPGSFVMLIVIALTLAACTSTEHFVAEPYEGWRDATPPPDSLRAYQVYLLGDVGGATREPLQPSLRLLKARLDAAAPESTAVVFLGDNIYCCGLHDSTASRRPVDEARLNAQLDAVRDFDGRTVFLPGNHDWNNDQPGALSMLRRQERYVDDTLGTNVFLPDNGFPGPVQIDLTEHLSLVILDTAWWLYPHDKPYGDTGDYDLDEDADFLLELDDVLLRERQKDVLVVAHHPLYSNGIHSGRIGLRDQIFPLRRVDESLRNIPLPIVGVPYRLFVRYVGGVQDMAHPRYKALRNALLQIFAPYERLIYAASHEHNLQYFPDPLLKQHFVVSGSASRPEPVGRGRGAAFTSDAEGLAVIHFYRDGSSWLEFIVPKDDGAAGETIFRTELNGPDPERVDAELPPVASGYPTYADSTVTVAANPDYGAGPIKRFFLGSHHRKLWTTPVTAPVLDLGTDAGGLMPVKRGGGQQTISLRLESADGVEYNLRSIDKDPSRTVPINLQGTIATDIVQDQIASLHPYAAFAIPRLAEAAGVYYTNPRLVYVPDDPRLGLYRETFADQLMMLEERPDDDMSAWPSSGGSENVISPQKFYDEINDDNDHRADTRFFARARLFDMWLSDWDRHEDQWRWASFEPYELDPTLEGEAREQGKVYRPIARDRDFALNKMDGLFPRFAPYFDPKFQDFTESYGSLKGLALNGLHQDRRLLSSLERDDWIEIAESLQASLTDEAIDEALRDWPPAIYERDAAETARLLKIRRGKLREVAEEFYEMHARIVDVVGSNKHERFEVQRGRETTHVIVYKTTKEGEIRQPIYERTFLDDETEEIRLYGLDGRDQFIIEGEGGPKIRAIGGPGEDRFVDSGRGATNVYDTETGNTIEAGRDTKINLSDDDISVNRYDPKEFQHDQTFPLAFFGSNKDDGLFVGGGIHLLRHGFRKRPYASSQRIRANVAAKTRAFNVVYGGHFVGALGAWDLQLDAAFLSPNNIRNFYGLGNQTRNTVGDREFYQARLTQARLAPAARKSIDPGVTYQIGPTFQFTKIRQDDDRVVVTPQPGIADNTFDDQWFAGVEAAATFETVDSDLNPKLGFSWSNAATLNVGVRNATETYSRLSTDLAIYGSPSLSPQVTVALRVGAAHNIGDFPFYEANTLGGKDNLRGFRSTRFAGRTSFYQNAELRLQLFRFSSYLAIGRAGVLGFVDNGRVWTEADDDKPVSQAFFEGYHQGYGGGVWAEFFNLFVFTATAGFSDDDQIIGFGLGFQY